MGPKLVSCGTQTPACLTGQRILSPVRLPFRHSRTEAVKAQEETVTQQSGTNVDCPDLRNEAQGKASKSEGFSKGLAKDSGMDADLARLIDAWPNLPEHIRVAVLDLIQSAAK